ncbi:hypothetical protein B0H13DRAFT_2324085 [Mycena leptocephala]|nr:hypothetical protein B0H13DRAFT_2324085 [Mycena leptocephala]
MPGPNRELAQKSMRLLCIAQSRRFFFAVLGLPPWVDPQRSHWHIACDQAWDYSEYCVAPSDRATFLRLSAHERHLRRVHCPGTLDDKTAWPLEGPLVRPRTVDDAWPSFNANATKASNTLAMQLRSPQTRDEIAIHQEWDDGAASTVVASEVMHNPSARRNVNAPMHLLYDSKSSFGTTSLAMDLSEYIPVFNNSSFAFGFSPDLHLHVQEEDYTSRASVGPQNYHAHSSINNHETMLASSDSRHRNLHSTGRSYGVVCATASENHGDHGGRPYTSQSAYQPSYHATTTGEHGRPSSAAESSRSHSQRPRSPFPRLEPHSPCLHLPPATVVQDFVSMNDTFILTDLPENSPFSVIPADSQRESFPGYPYPEGRRWTQTFKITEIKQIGPRKQTVACFFCRSRKIAYTPRPVERRTISLAGRSLMSSENIADQSSWYGRFSPRLWALAPTASAFFAALDV